MTQALTWTPFAFVVTMALWRMLSSLPDRLGESRTPEIIGKSTGLILATAGLGALYFVGGMGGAVVLGGGGPSARGAAAGGGGGGGGITVLFHCDWPTAGATVAAAEDCGAVDWSSGGSATRQEVVNAASAGIANWPSTNAFAIECVPISGTDGCLSTHVNADSIWAQPAAGEVWTWRWYVQVDSLYAVGVGGTDHPLEDTNGGFGANNFSFNIQSATDAWTFVFSTLGNASPDNGWCPTTTATGCVSDKVQLATNHTYRVEWQMNFLTDTTYNAHARVYDVPGDSLLYDDADFKNNNGTSTLADSLTLDLQNPPDLRRLMIGTSAIGTDETTTMGLSSPVPMYKWGALAVCKGGWCGPYPIAGVEN